MNCFRQLGKFQPELNSFENHIFEQLWTVLRPHPLHMYLHSYQYGSVRFSPTWRQLPTILAISPNLLPGRRLRRRVWRGATVKIDRQWEKGPDQISRCSFVPIGSEECDVHSGRKDHKVWLALFTVRVCLSEWSAYISSGASFIPIDKTCFRLGPRRKLLTFPRLSFLFLSFVE